MEFRFEKGQLVEDDVFNAAMSAANKRTRNPLFAPTAQTMETARQYAGLCDVLSEHVTLGITLQTKYVIKRDRTASEAQLFDIENDYRYFAKRMNYALFKKGSRRTPERSTLLMLPTLEGRGFSPDGHKTLHYHVAVGNLPQGLDLLKFTTLIRQLWTSTRCGKDDVVISPADEGWTAYITKELSSGNVDCIDWPNASIPYEALNIRSE